MRPGRRSDEQLPPVESRNGSDSSADSHRREGEAGDEPPIQLTPAALRVYRGEDPVLKADGTADRSRTLLKIGRVLFDAGANRGVIVVALRERDGALGYRKYSDRADADAQYNAICDELEREGRNETVDAKQGHREGARKKVPEHTDDGLAQRFTDRYGDRFGSFRNGINMLSTMARNGPRTNPY